MAEMCPSVDIGERRAETMPGDNVEGIGSLLLEHLSRGVSRCQRRGGAQSRDASR